MTETTSPSGIRTGYAPVNGFDMYYEIHGDGQPLVLRPCQHRSKPRKRLDLAAP
jgi:hypothetical protein